LASFIRGVYSAIPATSLVFGDKTRMSYLVANDNQRWSVVLGIKIVAKVECL